MPIAGISKRGLAFPIIGQIRKGEKVGNKLVDLDYFRVEFADDEEKADADFRSAFGDHPKEIVAVMPFDDIAACWDYWREAYIRAGGNAGGMLIHRCDGEYIEFERNPRTKEVIISGGRDVKSGERIRCSGVVYSYQKDDKQVDVKCKQVGRLKLIIPHLARMAYVMLHTTSWYDVCEINSNLAAIKELNGGHIVGIPLRIRRKVSERNTPFGRRELSLIFIEADPVWVARKILSLQTEAMPNLLDPVDNDLPGPDWDPLPEQGGQIVEDSGCSCAPPPPHVFASPQAAITWGCDQGCFKSKEHAKNAYEKLKSAQSPSNAEEMGALWRAEVARRIEGAPEEGGRLSVEAHYIELVDRAHAADIDADYPDPGWTLDELRGRSAALAASVLNRESEQ